VTARTVRILFVVGAIFFVLGVVRLAIGNYIWGGLGIALGIAMVLRGLSARGRAI
jgi:hypothetical protein